MISGRMEHMCNVHACSGRQLCDEGPGQQQSWQSCSHGAGRRMSRTRAREAISQVAWLFLWGRMAVNML